MERRSFFLRPLMPTGQSSLYEGSSFRSYTARCFISPPLMSSLQPTLSSEAPSPSAFPTAVVSLWLRSEEHTSELQSRGHLVCRLLLEKKNGQSLQCVY